MKRDGKAKRPQVPRFSTEDEERAFWADRDSTEYIDFAQAKAAAFPNLKPSLRTISLRLPESLIGALKVLAHKEDVPYQSLLKVLLYEAVQDRMKR